MGSRGGRCFSARAAELAFKPWVISPSARTLRAQRHSFCAASVPRRIVWCPCFKDTARRSTSQVFLASPCTRRGSRNSARTYRSFPRIASRPHPALARRACAAIIKPMNLTIRFRTCRATFIYRDPIERRRRGRHIYQPAHPNRRSSTSVSLTGSPRARAYQIQAPSVYISYAPTKINATHDRHTFTAPLHARTYMDMDMSHMCAPEPDDATRTHSSSDPSCLCSPALCLPPITRCP